MSLTRHMEPEWLDELTAGDPRALASRRDLNRINRLMLQNRIMTRLLKRQCERPRTLVELGGGDGTFLLGVARSLASHWPGVKATLVDRQNIVTESTRDAFRGLGWQLRIETGDVFDFLQQARPELTEIVCANLFLHHFSRDDLTRLLAGVARVGNAFAACEPRRSTPSLIGSKLLFAIGCNDVTRHDAVASVRAGFFGDELSQSWPKDPRWALIEHGAMPFTHCFAGRKSP